MRKDFVRKGFSWRKRDKDKPSESSEHQLKVMSRSQKYVINEIYKS
jgi:hypothetical protein